MAGPAWAQQAVADARIEGEVTYPSEEIPPGLEVCAEPAQGGEAICVSDLTKREGREIATGFSIAVPAGRYHVYARLGAAAAGTGFSEDYRAYYNEFVTCGYQASCASHAPIEVEAIAGQSVLAEPGDWYDPNQM